MSKVFAYASSRTLVFRGGAVCTVGLGAGRDRRGRIRRSAFFNDDNRLGRASHPASEKWHRSRWAGRHLAVVCSASRLAIGSRAGDCSDEQP